VARQRDIDEFNEAYLAATHAMLAEEGALRHEEDEDDLDDVIEDDELDEEEVADVADDEAITDDQEEES
jgi:hypothetical protein